MILKGSLPYSIFSSIHRTFARAIHDPCLFSIYARVHNSMHDVRAYIHDAFNAADGFDLRHHAYSAVHNIIKSYDT
jgi:hypothetical protein